MTMISLPAGRFAVGAVLSLMILMPSVAFAYDVPPNDGFVTDTVGILAKDQEASLEQRLRQYRDETSNEIAVVIVKSLHGEAIEDAGLEIGRKWGVGSTKNNGILLLIAYDDHEVRFDVGYGLEGAVPDLVAKGIIDEDIVPAFRDGDYFTGIASTIDSLQKHIGGEYTAERYAATDGDGISGSALFFFGFIVLQWLIAILGRTKSWWVGGVIGGFGGLVLALVFSWWLAIPILIPLGLLLDFLVSRNFQRRGPTAWWAGGGWGPGGGSGFGGFGGGSFGGGGASGRW